MPIELYGTGSALAAALCWSVAVILFKRSGAALDPIGLNLFKSVVALALLAATLAVIGNAGPSATPRELLFLLVSGAVGIGLADSLFFVSLNILGASRQAVVDCSYSPFIVLFSVIVLGEWLTWLDALGGLLIIGAVLTVVARRPEGELSRRRFWLGVACGVGGMAAMGLAIVAVKPLLEKLDLVYATVIRLVGGVTSLGILLAAPAGRRRILPVFKPQRMWRFALPASIVGNYAAMLFWIAGFKYTDASIAAILNQTSTVFIVILAALFLSEPLSPRRLVAVGLGFAGSVLVLV